MKIGLFEYQSNMFNQSGSSGEASQHAMLFGDHLKLKMKESVKPLYGDTAGTTGENLESRQLISEIEDMLEQLRDQEKPILGEAELAKLQGVIDAFVYIEDIEAAEEEKLQIIQMITDGMVNSMFDDNSNEISEAIQQLEAELAQLELLVNQRLHQGRREDGLLNKLMKEKQTDQAHHRGLGIQMKEAHGHDHPGQIAKTNGHKPSQMTKIDSDILRMVDQGMGHLQADDFILTLAGREHDINRAIQGSRTEESLPSEANAGASNINPHETDEVIVRLTEKAPTERQARELIRQFTMIIKKSHFTQTNQMKNLTIRLYPEHLGSLRIELMQKDGGMIARILASTKLAKDMLDSQVHHLKQAFVQQNIQLDKVEVTYQEGMEKNSKQNQREHEEQAEPRQEQQEATIEEDKENFSQYMANILFETEV